MADPPEKPAETDPAYAVPDGTAKAKAEILLAGTRPAPAPDPIADLENAFREAIQACDHLAQNYPEASIPFEGAYRTVGEIADLASLRLSDDMPDDINWRLHQLSTPMLLDKYLESREGHIQTWAAGGKCLRAMYDKVKDRSAQSK